MHHVTTSHDLMARGVLAYSPIYSYALIMYDKNIVPGGTTLQILCGEYKPLPNVHVHVLQY